MEGAIIKLTTCNFVSIDLAKLTIHIAINWTNDVREMRRTSKVQKSIEYHIYKLVGVFLGQLNDRFMVFFHRFSIDLSAIWEEEVKNFSFIDFRSKKHLFVYFYSRKNLSFHVFCYGWHFFSMLINFSRHCPDVFFMLFDGQREYLQDEVGLVGIAIRVR